MIANKFRQDKIQVLSNDMQNMENHYYKKLKKYSALSMALRVCISISGVFMLCLFY